MGYRESAMELAESSIYCLLATSKNGNCSRKRGQVRCSSHNKGSRRGSKKKNEEEPRTKQQTKKRRRIKTGDGARNPQNPHDDLNPRP